MHAENPESNGHVPHAPRPNPETIITVLHNEVNQLTENRLFMTALLEDTKAEAQREIAKRDSLIASLRQKIGELGGDAEDAQMESIDTDL